MGPNMELRAAQPVINRHLLQLKEILRKMAIFDVFFASF